jgi:hypothetical protein
MALYDDFYDNLFQYGYLRPDEAKKQELEAKLPGIVQAIISLPLQIAVSDAKAQHLLDCLRGIRNARNRLHVVLALQHLH